VTVTRQLLREGEWTRDGRMLTIGGVTWRDQIPLMARGDKRDGFDGSHLIGVVTNIRREGNVILGELSVDIDDNLIVTCEVDSVEDRIERPEGVEFVTARLVAATVARTEHWPWEKR